MDKKLRHKGCLKEEGETEQKAERERERAHALSSDTVGNNDGDNIQIRDRPVVATALVYMATLGLSSAQSQD